ncbi:MAG: hypothetical protein Q9225_007623 [Loekoesia sp. 1 TL-2023]
MEPTTSTGEGLPVYFVGQHESRRQLPVTPEVLRQAQDCNYDMLTTPITTPLFHSRVLALLSNHLSDLKDACSHEQTTPTIPSLSPADTPLTPGEIIMQLVGYASPWIDLSSPDPVVYDISRQVLELEISYAAFCGLGNVVIPGPKLQYGNSHGEGIAQYAYAVQEALALSNYTQISIQLPMMYHPDQDSKDVAGSLSPFARPEYVEEGAKSKLDFLGTWDAWHIIRTFCKYNSRLFVALSIPRYLPAIHAQTRWHSEPLRLLSLTAQTFLPNAHGYPVLMKEYPALIHRYMRLRTPPWIVLCDVGPIPGLDNPEAKIPRADGFIDTNAASDAIILPTPAEAAQLQYQHEQQQRNSKNLKDPTPQLSYIRNLQRKQPPRTVLEQFSARYQDYLQGPLQPLADNLESVTYEVFEQDPIKYDLYEQAIKKALIDWTQQSKSVSSPNGHIVVAVVGAGRGPLATRALRASEDTGIKIELWAVEKNPNAYVLLQRHNELSWQGQVHLVQSDMRSWKGPSTSLPLTHQQQQQHQQQHPSQISTTSNHYKIDILISELLGSFADNELSPECLDGITPLLNPTHGISIPASYTSYLTPIAAPKLHADISSRTPSDPTAPNTPYVVWLHAIDYLSTTPASPISVGGEPIVLAAWSFRHGPRDGDTNEAQGNNNKHNTRSARLTFPAPHRGACHGLAGYFEAVLYGDVELSTHPLRMASKSPDMMSWFPIYFPLKTPLYTPDSSLLTVTIRRATDNRKVWYEWMVESFLQPDEEGGKRDSKRPDSGKKVRLGCSEVGSSRENGCMM